MLVFKLLYSFPTTHTHTHHDVSHIGRNLTYVKYSANSLWIPPSRVKKKAADFLFWVSIDTQTPEWEPI